MDVKTTALRVIEIDNWRADIASEDIFAELKPVVGPKKQRSHRENLVGNLEPSKFCADLPHPLASILVNVIGLVPHIVTAISRNVSTSLDSPLTDHRDHVFNRCECYAIKNIAHLLS